MYLSLLLRPGRWHIQDRTTHALADSNAHQVIVRVRWDGLFLLLGPGHGRVQDLAEHARVSVPAGEQEIVRVRWDGLSLLLALTSAIPMMEGCLLVQHTQAVHELIYPVLLRCLRERI